MNLNDKPKVPSYEYKKFLQKLVKAHNAFDDCRSTLNDLEIQYDVPSYINEEQIEESMSLIEKGLGWTILDDPKLVDIQEGK